MSRSNATITVLVNNAGIIGAIKPTEDMTDADFAQICDVYMTGVSIGGDTPRGRAASSRISRAALRLTSG